MMEANSNFQLFSSASSSEKNKNGGLSFLDNLAAEDPLPPPPPPPPPSTEVLSSECSSSEKWVIEPMNLGGLTLLKCSSSMKCFMEPVNGEEIKYEQSSLIDLMNWTNAGRVSTKDVFKLPNSDLVPGVYEGGLKLWEGSLDLVKALQSEIQNGNLTLSGKNVLELGCGHGLPGIYSCLEGALAVDFQDFNAQVLRCLTIPNVNVNLEKCSQPAPTSEVRFFAGDWSQIHQLLYVHDTEKDLSASSEQSLVAGYDIILMAETIYSNSANKSLYGLIKKCLKHPDGVVYMAAKKYYFGVGGGTRQFLSMVEKDGIMTATLIAEIADGSSNVREVWRLSLK